MPLEWEGLTKEVKKRLAAEDPVLASAFAEEQKVASEEAMLKAQKERLAFMRSQIAEVRLRQQMQKLGLSSAAVEQQPLENKHDNTWIIVLAVVVLIVFFLLIA